MPDQHTSLHLTVSPIHWLLCNLFQGTYSTMESDVAMAVLLDELTTFPREMTVSMSLRCFHIRGSLSRLYGYPTQPNRSFDECGKRRIHVAHPSLRQKSAGFDVVHAGEKLIRMKHRASCCLSLGTMHRKLGYRSLTSARGNLGPRVAGYVLTPG